MISGLLLTPNPLGSRSLPTMNANSSAFPASRSRIGSAAILDILKSVTDSTQSGDNKGTIRSDIRSLVVSKDVRRHRLISIDYITTLRCHGRGREFESRRPRHFFSDTYRIGSIPAQAQKGTTKALAPGPCGVYLRLDFATRV